MDEKTKVLLGREAWQLRRNGQYEKAIELCTQLYNEDPTPFNLFDRGMTYLEMADYASALEDFKRVVDIQEPTLMADVYYIFQGVCYWYLNQPSQAVEVWKQGITAPYTDAAGGVTPPALLLYAAQRLHDAELNKEALRLLRKHARRKLREWPGAIVPFLLGKIGVEELETKVKLAVKEILIARWQCQADFYIALRALREGDWAAFQSRMTRCAENPYGYHEHEHYLALWEAERGFPRTAFL
jgi:lipoprotein NlpI